MNWAQISLCKLTAYDHTLESHIWRHSTVERAKKGLYICQGVNFAASDKYVQSELFGDLAAKHLRTILLQTIGYKHNQWNVKGHKMGNN